MQQVARLIVVVLLIVLVGSALFATVEQITYADALYFTLATLTTVGYGDMVPTTEAGRAVAVVLMLGGIGAALYLFSSVVAFVVEGKLRRVLGIRRMMKMIGHMRRHYIICGYGKLGRQVAQGLEASQADFVVVESDPSKVAAARERGYAVVEGDATLQETLDEAGLDRAAGVATTISDDAENVYIGITVRSRHPDLPVVCRSSSERVRDVFQRAGIHRTISTDEMGARRIVGSLLRPHVVGFMDEITRHVPGRPALDAVRIGAGAPLVGQTIMGAGLRDKYGIVVLAIRRPRSVRVEQRLQFEAEYLPNPGPQEEIQAGDILILIGTPEEVVRLRTVAEVGSEEGDANKHGA